MGLVYSLKLLADLLIYLTFAGLVSALTGGGGLFSTLLFFTPCAVLLGLLANRGRAKYSALALLIPLLLFAFAESSLQLMLLLPAFAYILYYTNKLPYDVKLINYPGVFKIYMSLNLIAAFIFLAWVHVAAWVISAVLIPYILIFSPIAVFLMHLVRHEREVLAHTRFKLISALSFALVFTAAVLLSSEWAIGLAGAIWETTSTFIIIAIIAACAVLTLMHFFKRDLHRIKEYFSISKLIGTVLFLLIVISFVLSLFQKGGEIQALGGFGEEGQGLNIWLIILLAFIILILFMMALYLLRLLYELARMLYSFLTGKNEKAEPRPEFTRISLDNEKNINKKSMDASSNQIRHIYKKFLKLCKKRKVEIEPRHTTEDIAKNFGSIIGDFDNATKLRAIYLDSRYGEKIISPEDIKDSKDIYRKLKQTGK